MADKGGGFSFASLISSYFMVAGGITLGLVGMVVGLKHSTLLQSHGDLAFYGLFAVGGFVGAFFAARASRGVTILEPAIGAVLVIASFIGLALSTELGKLVFNVARDKLTQVAAISGGCAAVGSIIGAFLSEKLFGEATRSFIPWILYVALAVLGGCFMATLAAATIVSHEKGASSGDQAATLILIGIGAGCLLAGITSGALSRTGGVILSALFGGFAGTFGFAMLIKSLMDETASVGDSKDFLIGAVVFGVGGGIVALLGSTAGWYAAGKRNAD